MLRTLLAFLVAPAVPTLLIYVVQFFAAERWEAAWAASVIAIFGYLGALILGAPAHLILRSRAVTSLGAYLFVGMIIGVATYALVAIPSAISQWKHNSAETALLMLKNTAGFGITAAACGLIAGIVFWSIAIRKTGLAS